ncbi:hypothetical protein AB0H98_32155 [Nocardia salmonicida]|uniref:hypothetical protein n=1 Tax=Nocardia salmonicida TaxID=53431 RepID=UPI0033E5C716
MEHHVMEGELIFGNDSPVDWLGTAWTELSDRSRAVYVARNDGATLQEIGDLHGFTREYARQILGKVERHIRDRAEVSLREWRDALVAACAEMATPQAELARAVGVANHTAVRILAEAAGLRPPRTWAGDLIGWWSTDSTALAGSLKKIVDAAPFRNQALTALATEHEIPDGAPLETLLAHKRSPLVQGIGDEWLRRRARFRDAAYLWLLERGSPQRVEMIAPAIHAESPRAIAESMRRDDRFVQIRPEGTWALVEWPGLDGTGYRSASEVVIDLVTKFGPISRTDLFAKAIQVYPVSKWRLEQCMVLDQIGETSDGLIDLVARGARFIDTAEPAKPTNMASNDDGTIYGIRITVDKDMIRGSGVLIHPWLTWRLGLRRAPMSMNFDTDDLPGLMVVRRNGSGAQLPSLRHFLLERGLVPGCEIVVVLMTESRVSRIRHACGSTASCPAQGLTRGHRDHR